MAAIFIGLGANGERQVLELSRANRHGLVAGATGTGKTVTLQGLAEDFSAAGVPVFLADVKGDLSGIAMAGSPTFKNADKLEARAAELGMTDYAYGDNPAVFWDLYGEQGHPIRTTVSSVSSLGSEGARPSCPSAKARGKRSLVKTTPAATNTRSSSVTPVQM